MASQKPFINGSTLTDAGWFNDVDDTVYGTYTLSNKTLVNPVVTNYVETVKTYSAGATFSPVYTDGTLQILPTNGNCTITLPTPVAGKSMSLIVQYGGTHTITFAGGTTIKYPGGTAPTATSTSGRWDIYIITSVDTSFTLVRDGGRNFS